MKLGAFDIQPVTDGRFRLDGGAMFGVVPRVLWEKCCPADDQNRIQLALTCLLIRAHGKHILVDTGLGNKLDAKSQTMFAVDQTPPLHDSLHAQGLAAEDIHMVINTHLHFDHSGGNTVSANGRHLPTFPKAKYFVQRGEYEDAMNANERTKASYRCENFAPIEDLKQWGFLQGDTELLPGISVVVTHGHTAYHQGVKIESEGKVAFYLGDLIPTVSHLPLPYIMGYDLYPLQTLATKRWILDKAFNEGWLLIFEHDPRVQMGYVKKDIEGKYYLEAVKG
ncbi:MAG: MBL fold metallo-hydrolase [Nitrospirota bacterium]|nr:MBL fold metallo-hydrolase [Nitrospirota bacterium]